MKITKETYDRAWSFTLGTAMVKDGEYYYLIDSNFKKLGRFEFEDFINFNEKGICFIKLAGAYRLARLASMEE